MFNQRGMSDCGGLKTVFEEKEMNSGHGLKLRSITAVKSCIVTNGEVIHTSKSKRTIV